MTDECILVFLSVHFRPRASSQRLDFGDEHRRSLAGQESIDFGAQQSFVAQRAYALHAGGFGDPGNVRSGGSLASRTAPAAEKLLVIEDHNIKIFWLARADYGQDARREQHAAVGIEGKDSAFRQSRGQTESHLTDHSHADEIQVSRPVDHLVGLRRGAGERADNQIRFLQSGFDGRQNFSSLRLRTIIAHRQHLVLAPSRPAFDDSTLPQRARARWKNRSAFQSLLPYLQRAFPRACPRSPAAKGCHCASHTSSPAYKCDRRYPSPIRAVACGSAL